MERSIQAQAQIRRDAEEHGRALRELQEWEEEMKRREEEQQADKEQQRQDTQAAAAAAATTTTPEEQKVAAAMEINNRPPPGLAQPGRSSSAAIDGRNDDNDGVRIGVDGTVNVAKGGGALSMISNDANQSPADMANTERQRGNDCYAAGKYDDAIKCYTVCLRFDPQSAVAYSNRAMTHLKKRDWRKAEDDASMALTIDASHVKSYQRRSVARASLGMLRAALLDLSRAEAELELLDGSDGGGSTRSLQKSIASERRRVESLLRAAMKRAPKRCNVPVAVVHDEEEGKEEAKKKGDAASVENDEMTSKETSIDNGSAGGAPASKESNDWVMVDTGDTSSGKEAIRTGTNNSPAKSLPARQHEKPKTWYEFETAWRSLDSLEERSAYLSSIKPKWLAVLYRNGMEDVEIVVDIVVAAAAMQMVEFNKSKLAAEYIRRVANTTSIGIPVMMMDDGQRKQVRDAIDKVFAGGDDGGEVVAAKLGCSK